MTFITTLWITSRTVWKNPYWYILLCFVNAPMIFNDASPKGIWVAWSPYIYIIYPLFMNPLLFLCVALQSHAKAND